MAGPSFVCQPHLTPLLPSQARIPRPPMVRAKAAAVRLAGSGRTGACVFEASLCSLAPSPHRPTPRLASAPGSRCQAQGRALSNGGWRSICSSPLPLLPGHSLPLTSHAPRFTRPVFPADGVRVLCQWQGGRCAAKAGGAQRHRLGGPADARGAADCPQRHCRADGRRPRAGAAGARLCCPLQGHCRLGRRPPPSR